MLRLFIISFVLFCTTCRADVASEPWPKRLDDLPSDRALVVAGFRITRRSSADQEGSGTGGSMYDVTIQSSRTGREHRLHEQSVGFAVLALYHGWPQLEIWGRAGGGSWCRSLFRLVGHEYQRVRTDAFTEFDFNAKDKTRTTTMPRSDDILYYVGTYLPERP